MRHYTLLALLLLTAMSWAEDRLYVPKVTPNETLVLEDGELVVVQEGDSPVGLRYGDGNATGGPWLFDARKTIRTSPVFVAEETDYTLELGGDAYWTNGVISMFAPIPSGADFTNVSGVVTVRLNSIEQRIESITPVFSGYFYSWNPSMIVSNGEYAVISAHSMELPPGAAAVIDCYLESLTINVYADAAFLNATQDMRGFVMQFRHPARTSNTDTNPEAFFPITKGWYDGEVQDSVARWSEHNGTNLVTIEQGLKMFDPITLRQNFSIQDRPNGYLDFIYEGLDTNVTWFGVRGIDPWPLIVDAPTGNVTKLTWTTNGLTSTSWVVQTCTNIAAPIWTNATVLATNQVPTGFMSLTVSNKWPGTLAFFRVRALSATVETPTVFTPYTFNAGNLTLSTSRWIDSAMIFQWKPLGVGAPDLATLPAPYDAISTLGWADNEYVSFMMQFNHNLAPSNTVDYIEPHCHVLPLTGPPSNANRTKIKIVYAGASISGTLYGPITNTTEVALYTNKHTLVEFAHLPFTNWYPGISGKVWGTITRQAASASNFTGEISLDGDFHYPVDRLGSATDATP